MTNRRLKAVDGLWLGIALLLHSALLLLPFGTPRELSSAPEAITVILDMQLKAAPPVKQPANQRAELSQEIQAQSTPPQPQPQPMQEPAPAPISVQNLPKTITATQLLHSVSNMKWRLPQNEKPMELGVFKTRPLPFNWLPSLKMDDNLFGSQVVSARTEIVNQWRSADGTNRVVVSSPSGQNFCGHARDWSAMNPLEEHVMVWRRCAGGGK